MFVFVTVADSLKVFVFNQMEETTSSRIPCSVKYHRISIDKIRLLEFLGGGAQGSVHKVRIKSKKRALKNKKFAVKLYKSSPNAFEAIEQAREIQVLLKLSHVNLPKLRGLIYKDKTDTKCKGIVLDLMRTTVHNEIYSINDVYPEDFKISWCFQAIEAIAYLHKKGIIHRDIKPQNMLLDSKGEILKVCDFGSARIIEEGSLSMGIGTIRYMAPELIDVETTRESHKFSKEVDVYSLSLSIIEIIYKKAPFADLANSTSMEFIKNISIPRCPFPELISWRRDDIKSNYPRKLENKTNIHFFSDDLIFFLALGWNLNQKLRFTVEDIKNTLSLWSKKDSNSLDIVWGRINIIMGTSGKESQMYKEELCDCDALGMRVTECTFQLHKQKRLALEVISRLLVLDKKSNLEN